MCHQNVCDRVHLLSKMLTKFPSLRQAFLVPERMKLTRSHEHFQTCFGVTPTEPPFPGGATTSRT